MNHPEITYHSFIIPKSGSDGAAHPSAHVLASRTAATLDTATNLPDHVLLHDSVLLGSSILSQQHTCHSQATPRCQLQRRTVANQRLITDHSTIGAQSGRQSLAQPQHHQAGRLPGRLSAKHTLVKVHQHQCLGAGTKTAPPGHSKSLQLPGTAMHAVLVYRSTLHTNHSSIMVIVIKHTTQNE